MCDLVKREYIYIDFIACIIFMQLPFLRSALPCQKNSTRESSTIRIGRLVHDFKDERKCFVDSMLCYSYESMC